VGVQSRSSSGVARLLDGDPDGGTSSSMKSNAAPSGTAEPDGVGPFSDHDKTVFIHLLTAERSAHAKLRSPTVESAQRLGLIDVEDEDDDWMTASTPWKNAEERDEKRSCPSVSYGRVSDSGRRESRRSG
jgi:hypothetical protein